MHENEVYDDLEENDGEDVELSVFISHGKSSLWKSVEKYIQDELDLPTLVLSDVEDPGRFPIEKLDDETNDCFFGIVVMTAEDEELDPTGRSKSSLLYEIGFLQGKFGIENVLVLKQDTIKEFQNISGITYESFTGTNIKSTFARIMEELDLAIDAVEDVYHEEND